MLKTPFTLGETMEVLLQSCKNADQFCIDSSQRGIYLPKNLFKRDITSFAFTYFYIQYIHHLGLKWLYSVILFLFWKEISIFSSSIPRIWCTKQYGASYEALLKLEYLLWRIYFTIEPKCFLNYFFHFCFLPIFLFLPNIFILFKVHKWAVMLLHTLAFTSHFLHIMFCCLVQPQQMYISWTFKNTQQVLVQFQLSPFVQLKLTNQQLKNSRPVSTTKH